MMTEGSGVVSEAVFQSLGSVLASQGITSAEWVYDTVEKNKYPWAITSSPMNRFSYH